tara:strand:- start:1233 stop:2426 length:1194 start_codon:yes stop_codon:yes gene_type:complete
MSDSTVNVSGSDQAYAIDAVRVGNDGDYRQVLTIGDFTNSGIDGSMATVAASALSVSAGGALLTGIDTVLDNIKVDTEAIETATEAIQVDAAAIEALLTLANVDHAANEVLLTGIDADTNAIKVDAAAIEVLLTNANTDHAANEVLLTSIDADTNAIKVDAAAIEVLLTGIDADTDAIKTDAAAIEVLLTNANTDHAANEVLLTSIDADTNAIKVDTAANEVLLTAIDTVLDTIKVDTEAIETAVESSVANAGNVLTLKRNVIAPATGLDVNIRPATSSYLSHVYLDLDAAGDNPATNTEVIAAGGADTKLVIYGVQGSISSAGASDYGNWYLTDGNAAVATTLWVGRIQGTAPTQFELTFPYGVALTANTALKVTSTEGSGNIFINTVIYYRTEAV